MLSFLYNFLEILIVLVPILLSVAFMTIIERKVIGSIQRRVGPNVVGYYGVLQPLLKISERHHFYFMMKTELYAEKSSSL